MSYYLILNSKEYELPERFKKVLDIPESLYNKLKENNKKYTIQSNVSEEVFQTFLRYLIEGTLSEIHIDSFVQLNELAREFGIEELKTAIEKKKQKWIECEKILENLQSPTGTTSIELINQQIQEIRATNEQNFQQFQHNFQITFQKIFNRISEIEKSIQNQQVEYQLNLTEQQNLIKKYEDLLNEKKSIN